MHTISGSISLPSGVLFAFPHGTGSLSVDYEYLALEDGPPCSDRISRVPPYFVPTLFPLLNFRVRGYHPLWPDFPDCSTNSEAKGCRLFRVRSPLLAESRLISFPPVLRCFQFTGFALPKLCISLGSSLAGGFPIQISTDQSSIASSP